jgi:undecaprenyl phosphate N,N'-diacetylbacillosamine 1-phosphate transferase
MLTFMYRNIFKPILDFILSITMLVTTSPLLLFITIVLAIYNKGNPFFTQTRPGKNAHLFQLIKFKTMTELRDEHGMRLPDKNRLTFFGSLLRATSIDELPQLLNVVKGDMSLIGPRPLMPQYLSLYNREQAKRHNIKPGISGWAQVNGRNAISWKQKFEYDVWYVENFSFFVDVKIVYLTLRNVIRKEGIYKGEVIESMEAFNGFN